MKSLLLVRHAKSSWNFDVDDFDRPLNERGLKDGPEMAKRLIKKEIRIDCFVSSPAKRALTTASLFAEAYDKNSKDIITAPTLYEATTEDFYNVLETLDADFKTVALFSHNPSITNFANQLTSVTIDDMPTCSVFAVKADGKSWKDISTIPKKFWFFDYPKSE